VALAEKMGGKKGENGMRMRLQWHAHEASDVAGKEAAGENRVCIQVEESSFWGSECAMRKKMPTFVAT
jgi:hypothetical protein